MNIYFDAETGPIAHEQLLATIPAFDASKYPELPPFDEADVKLGALKDEAKIKTKIQQARQKHAEAVLEHANKVKQAEDDHFAKHVERAALSAITGRVLMIAVRKGGSNKAVASEDERELLTDWWRAAETNYRSGHRFVGFNIFHFDLPFLVRRSWKHGVEVPGWVRNGRYWSEAFVDLMDTYQMGNRDQSIKLDDLDKYLGGAGKNGHGADFYVKWQTEREVAIAYAFNDVEILERLARRMGVDEHVREELVAAQRTQKSDPGSRGASESAREYWGA